MLVLAPLTGAGVIGDDPFRVDGAQQIIDLRPDARVRDGWALALLVAGAPAPSGSLVLTDAPSGPDASNQRLSGSIRNQLSNRLSLTVPSAALGSIFGEVLLSGDERALGVRTRWRSLRPSRRRLRHEIWLGGLLWSQPIIAGGATVTENWAGIPNGTTINGTHTWTKVSEGSGAGAWQINAERLFLDGTEAFNSARCESPMDTDDHTVTADVTFTTGSSNQGGVCARFASAANTFYTCEASPRNGRAPWLEKVVAGAATDLGFTSNSVPLGTYSISLEVDGSSLAGNVTGFVEQTATDTDITGNLRMGARARGRNTGEHAWDNYVGQDISAGQTIAVGQVAEADTAQPIGRAKIRVISQVTETDTAQPITESSEIVEPVNQVTETDVVQPIGKVKALGIDQVTETDVAQSIAVAKALGVGQITETDIAQPIGMAKTRALGQVIETDAVQLITPTFGHIVGQVTETDLAQSMDRLKERLLGQVTEIDGVQPVAVVKVRELGQVIETDIAQQIVAAFGHVLGQISETDLVQQIAETIALAQVVEVDTAQPITVIIGVIPGPPDGPRTLVAVESGHTLIAVDSGHTLDAVESGHTLVVVE